MRRLLLASVCASLAGGCAAARQEYAPNQRADTVPYLRIMKVAVDGDSTRVTFRYRTVGAGRRSISVHGPGKPGAFAIQDLDGKRRYTLRAVENVAVAPERTEIPAESRHDFVLVFDPIPASMRAFRIGEGGYDPAAGENAWQFARVDLTGVPD